MEMYKDYLVNWLKVKVKQANANGIIVGVSGGIDSAVVASLIKEAFPDNSIGLILPCYSSNQDVSDALKVVEQLSLKYEIVNLDNTFDTIKKSITKHIVESNSFGLAMGNTKARLRMTTLYAFAQNYNYLVCGTDNACEWFTGYFTKYGDGGVDIAPLIHLSKTQVYDLARVLNVDSSIINKAPSAGLFEDQTDEQEMQVSYNELEKYMNNETINLESQKRIAILHKNSEHKRNGISFPEKKVCDLK